MIWWLIAQRNFITPPRRSGLRISKKEGNYRSKRYTNPNGLILSPDEKTLYVSEYVPKNIISFAVGQSGELSDRALFAKMDDGLPKLKGADGMCGPCGKCLLCRTQRYLDMECDGKTEVG